MNRLKNGINHSKTKKKNQENNRYENCTCSIPVLLNKPTIATDGHIFDFCMKCEHERIIKKAPDK